MEESFMEKVKGWMNNNKKETCAALIFALLLGSFLIYRKVNPYIELYEGLKDTQDTIFKIRDTDEFWSKVWENNKDGNLEDRGYIEEVKLNKIGHYILDFVFTRNEFLSLIDKKATKDLNKLEQSYSLIKDGNKIKEIKAKEGDKTILLEFQQVLPTGQIKTYDFSQKSVIQTEKISVEDSSLKYYILNKNEANIVTKKFTEGPIKGFKQYPKNIELNIKSKGAAILIITIGDIIFKYNITIS